MNRRGGHLRDHHQLRRTIVGGTGIEDLVRIQGTDLPRRGLQAATGAIVTVEVVIPDHRVRAALGANPDIATNPDETAIPAIAAHPGPPAHPVTAAMAAQAADPELSCRSAEAEAEADAGLGATSRHKRDCRPPSGP
ncbi:Hypothetical protein NTJ_10953 [Nesidiocoris tenuis]|uniref:Uncharacterized protein n=1 Tax=Nesidiocoris tenuis TaxID=355587 RepID=A0ABN7B1M5_9HEMI|nr:Hypothetical protein NTJ_10953 [Nesidiocoris tenuis]